MKNKVVVFLFIIFSTPLYGVQQSRQALEFQQRQSEKPSFLSASTPKRHVPTCKKNTLKASCITGSILITLYITSKILYPAAHVASPMLEFKNISRSASCIPKTSIFKALNIQELPICRLAPHQRNSSSSTVLPFPNSLCDIGFDNGPSYYCEGNLGRSRADMPQTAGRGVRPGSYADKKRIMLGLDVNQEINIEQEFIQALQEKNIALNYTTVPLTELKPIQAEVSLKTATGISQAFLNGTIDASKPIFVTKDYYILDGHHRFYGRKLYQHILDSEILGLTGLQRLTLKKYQETYQTCMSKHKKIIEENKEKCRYKAARAAAKKLDELLANSQVPVIIIDMYAEDALDFANEFGCLLGLEKQGI